MDLFMIMNISCSARCGLSYRICAVDDADRIGETPTVITSIILFTQPHHILHSLSAPLPRHQHINITSNNVLG